jgi:hypothetical protein
MTTISKKQPLAGKLPRRLQGPRGITSSSGHVSVASLGLARRGAEMTVNTRNRHTTEVGLGWLAGWLCKKGKGEATRRICIRS